MKPGPFPSVIGVKIVPVALDQPSPLDWEVLNLADGFPLLPEKQVFPFLHLDRLPLAVPQQINEQMHAFLLHHFTLAMNLVVLLAAGELPQLVDDSQLLLPHSALQLKGSLLDTAPCQIGSRRMDYYLDPLARDELHQMEEGLSDQRTPRNHLLDIEFHVLIGEDSIIALAPRLRQDHSVH